MGTGDVVRQAVVFDEAGKLHGERTLAEDADMQRVFRQVVDGGGDVVAVALAARARGWGRHCVRAAKAFRDEFGVSLKEAQHFAAWIEGDGDGEDARLMLRERIPTPLR